MGSTIPQLVFCCCQSYPYEEVIKELIKLSDATDMGQLVQSIFSYEHKGENCLFAAFQQKMNNFYTTLQQFKKLKQLPKQPANSSIEMFNAIESLLIYFLQLAEQNNLDMDQVINIRREGGDSLFQIACLLSEKVSIELIKRNVKVNTIDNIFNTPLFMVRY